MGYITSFCTAGYRCGRTGKKIMNMLKSGEEAKFCKLNAILTFKEWLDDFADEETKKIGKRLIDKEIGEIRKGVPKIYSEKMFNGLMKYYKRISRGERDIYF